MTAIPENKGDCEKKPLALPPCRKAGERPGGNLRPPRAPFALAARRVDARGLVSYLTVMGHVIRFGVLSAAAVGFGAAVGQVAALRALLGFCGGDELAAGLALSGWLLWTAAGGWLSGAALRRVEAAKAGAWCLVGMGLGLLWALVWTSLAGKALGVGAGEAVGLGDAALAAFTAVGPFCVFSGVGFAAFWAVLSAGGKSAWRAYAAEAAGAAFGGAFAYVAAMWGWRPIASMAVCACVLGAAAFAWSRVRAGSGFRAAGYAGAALAVAGLGALAAQGRISHALDVWRYGPDVLAAADTPYNSLSVTGREGQVSFFANGEWLFTWPDAQSAEYGAHPAMLQHPAPGRVLLLGGSNLLEEILRHPGVRHVDVVERDAGVMRLAGRYAGAGYARALEDGRVATHDEDPAAFTRETKGPYDVVILTAGEPRSAQANRLYTVEFFRRVKEILAPDGVFAFTVPAEAAALGPGRRMLLGALYDSLRAVFSKVLVLPGEGAAFLARECGAFVDAPEALAAELAKRGISPAYYQEYFIFDHVSPVRAAMLRKRLARDENGERLNTDFEPVCFLAALAMWAQTLSPALKQAYLSALCVPQWVFWAVFGAAGALAALPCLRSPKNGVPYGAFAILSSVAGAGCAQMASGMGLMLGFQILKGDLYGSLACIVGAQMAGMACGALTAAPVLDRVHSPLRPLLGLQGLMALAPAGVWAFLRLSQVSGNVAPVAAFAALAALTGALGGLHFCLAAACLPGQAKGAAGGRVYAVDLFGAACGTLILTLGVMPLFGLRAALLAGGAACLPGFAGLMLPASKSRGPHSRTSGISRPEIP